MGRVIPLIQFLGFGLMLLIGTGVSAVISAIVKRLTGEEDE